MSHTITGASEAGSLLSSLLGDDDYHPPEPASFEETGVSPVLIETLVMKRLLQVGSCSGRDIANNLCLPFAILEDLLLALRSRQMLVHKGSAQLGDYFYTLTDHGADRARAAMQTCAYVGPVPVPLVDYILSVEAQSIRAEAVQRGQLEASDPPTLWIHPPTNMISSCQATSSRTASEKVVTAKCGVPKRQVVSSKR